MATYVPKACCLSGSTHSGTPTGKVTTIHDLPCYIADPPSSAPPKAIIVYLPDIFGWDIPNARLLADSYAKRTGARVYLPDFMAGYAFPASTMDALHTLMEPQPNILAAFYHKTWPFLTTILSLVWRVPYIGDKHCRPRITAFLRGIREYEARELGDVKVGVAGFCWGGHHVIDLCSGGNGVDGVTMEDGRPLVDAGFTAHPSNFEVKEHLERVILPLSISVGDVDFNLPVEKCKEAQRIIEAKQGELDARQEGQKGRYEVDIIPGAHHGFATRGHLDNKEEASQAKRGEDMAVAFWARWIGTNA